MATARAQPYSNCFFNVDLGTGQPLGFHEVQLPQLSELVVEYREGNDKVSGSHKLPARTQVGTLTLKRGFNGELSLYQWWRQVEQGDSAARRNLVIALLDELLQPVAQWKLRNAWPSRYYFSPLQGEGRGVLYEIMEVTCETLELE